MWEISNMDETELQLPRLDNQITFSMNATKNKDT